MAIVHECDNDGNALKTLSIQEKKNLWDLRIREFKDTLSQDDFDRIINEVYVDIYTSFSDTDFESSSSGLSVEVLMEIADSFDQAVMIYDHSSIDEVEISKIRYLKNISSIGNEDDVVLKLCISGECVL